MADAVEVVIGLEVHVELKTESKIFCACSTRFGSPPNTQVCPICLGHPGTLPVLNLKALELAVRAALALNCKVARYTKFDRKNYFYPDLPKGYQISQYDAPLAEHGWLEFRVDGRMRTARIRRVHLEEDAGKLMHDEVTGETLVDFNRCGVPLIEVVTEPDLRSPREARAFMEELRAVLQYAEVSDCRMQEGSLRCDANISLRPRGATDLGTKAEIKNLNSFRALEKALEYEVARQTRALERGERLVLETRGWDEGRQVTVPLRTKEEAHDYRYFPEPDLVPMTLDPEWVEQIRRSLPELPSQRMARFQAEYGLPAYDAGVIVASRRLADFFEECVRHYPHPKTVSNWVMGQVLGYLNSRGLEPEELNFEPERLAELLRMVDEGVISVSVAREVFEEAVSTGKSPRALVEEKGLEQLSDTGALAAVVRQVIEEHPSPVRDYRRGKVKALGFLMGQVMKKTAGKANPQLARRLLEEALATEREETP